jgi:predicted AAA+ superfamily ATPase
MIQRNITRKLEDAWADTPVILLIGARQTGKTTLAVDWAERHKARYETLDDAVVLAAAAADPQGFIHRLELPAVIDEVQKVPELLPAIKLRVDRKRTPGMFLITGSANVLSLPRISESLAGRMEIYTLWPLSQGERAGLREKFIPSVFSGRPPDPPAKANIQASLADLISDSGFPGNLKRHGARLEEWYRSYVTSMLQRNIRDLARIDGLIALPNLLRLLAARSCGLINTSDLTRDAGIPNSTLKRYLALLELLFLVYRLPAWSANLSKRLIKAPKVMLCDTGLSCHLLGSSRELLNKDRILMGRLLENFVGNELRKQASWLDESVEIMHYRTASGREIDFILEDKQGRVAAIEVKSSQAIKNQDFDAMQDLAEMTKSRFVCGVLLHDGNRVLPFGKKLWAAPISSLWSGEQD